MRWPRSRFTVRWLMAAIAVIAVGLCVAFNLWSSLEKAYRPREQLSCRWSAGATSNRSSNDMWIEYNPIDYRVSSVYRDCDGDGFVDERLMFVTSRIVLFRASSNDGLLDTMRYLSSPSNSATRLTPGAPESGPFTRDDLDERARTRPLVAPPDGTH